MRRVGLFLDFPPEGGGVFQYAHEILAAASQMQCEGVEVCVLYRNSAWAKVLQSFDDRVQSIFVASSWASDCYVPLLRFGFPLGLWRLLSKWLHPLTRKMLDLKCDLWIFPAQDVMTYAYPGRSLGTVHDLMHLYESRFPEVSQRGLFARRQRHYRRICKESAGILVDSPLGKLQLTQAYGIAGCKVFELPYAAPRYMQSPEVDSSISFPGIPAKYLFYPAQFWQHKNHLRLVRAFFRVLERIPDVHLVFAGSEKNSRTGVEREVESLGLSNRVHFLGYVPDSELGGLYRRSLGLIMPTYFGPTNIPPLEALAAHVPMAVSGIYGMRDQLGESAIYFNPDSETEIGEAIVALATDGPLREHLVRSGFAVAARWTYTHFALRFQSVVRHLLSHSKSITLVAPR